MKQTRLDLPGRITLSRRRLVFTDHEVHFECRVTSCSESVLQYENRTLQWAAISSGIGERSQDIYVRISEYAAKNQTRQLDALKAMLGIF